MPLVSTPAYPLASGRRDGDPGGMTSITTFPSRRTSETSDLVVPVGAAVTRPESGGNGRAEREHPLWQRLRRLLSPQQPSPELQHAILERMLTLLESARVELSAGWVQGGWWTTPAGGGRQALVRGPAD